MGTIGLILRRDRTTGKTVLDEVISDDREIDLIENLPIGAEASFWQRLEEFRRARAKEEDEFGDYVEEILEQPFASPEVKKHGLLWLKSKIRIEQFQRKELEASRVIAEYALKIFEAYPERRDLILKGPKSKVRVRIFELPFEVAKPAGVNAA